MAVPQSTHTELNPVQVSLLRLFNRPMSEEETREVKRLLANHYSDQLAIEVNKVVAEKEYSEEDFDRLLNADR